MQKDQVVYFLSYFGIALALASSLWGVFKGKALDAISGRTIVTRDGWITVGLILLGFTVTIASNLIKEQLDKEKAERRIAIERLAALKLAVASQPLQTLKLEWRFYVPKEEIPAAQKLEQEAEDNVESVSDDFKHVNVEDHSRWYGGNRRAHLLYGWFRRLIEPSLEFGDLLVRIPLNESGSAVLPVGILVDAVEEKIAAGVDSYNIINFDPASIDEEFFKQRTRWPDSNGSSSLSVTDDGALIEADIYFDPVVTLNSIDKVTDRLFTLAHMPNKLDIYVLANVAKSPWDLANFSGPMVSSMAPDVNSDYPGKGIGRLRIVVNELDEIASNYTLSLISRGNIVDPPGPEASDEVYAKYALIRAEKTAE